MPSTPKALSSGLLIMCTTKLRFFQFLPLPVRQLCLFRKSLCQIRVVRGEYPLKAMLAFPACVISADILQTRILKLTNLHSRRGKRALTASVATRNENPAGCELGWRCHADLRLLRGSGRSRVQSRNLVILAAKILIAIIARFGF